MYLIIGENVLLFLNTTSKHLSGKLTKLWTEKGRTYKGYYIIREGESLVEFLCILDKRKRIKKR